MVLPRQPRDQLGFATTSPASVKCFERRSYRRFSLRARIQAPLGLDSQELVDLLAF